MRILITGTSAGVGDILARHLLTRGHEVIGCSRRSSAIDTEGYSHHQVDLTNTDQIRSMFRAIRTDHGYLDALINNAATSNMNHFMMTPEHVARRIFDLNFFAVLASCREATKLLQRSQASSPAIVNMSSVAVLWPIDGQLVYSASKGALHQLTRVMSKELAGLGVRVNGIGLPPIRTFLTRGVPEAKLQLLVQRQAIQRMCTAEDIVGPVEFLISDRASYVTGETIFLGGVS